MDNKIFVIEGTDGCGKQTQSQKLLERLTQNGISAIRQSFPNYESISSGPVKLYLTGELSQTANGLNAYQASSLFAADRLCTIKQLEKTVPEDAVIVFDRYVSSNMLHQACKIASLKERDEFLHWLDEFEFNTLLLPRPTKIIFLDMPVEMSKKLANLRTDLKTGGAKDIHEADESHLKAAYEAGVYVAKKLGWEIIKCTNEKGEIKSIDEIHNEIWKSCFGKALEKSSSKEAIKSEQTKTL